MTAEDNNLHPTGEKLAVPQPTAGTATPSDISFKDEKLSDVDGGSLSEHDAEGQGEKLANVASAASATSSAMKLTVIVIALVMSIFLVALDMTIVATAIPRITDEFKSLEDVGWYGSAFFLTVASFQSTVSAISEIFECCSSRLIVQLGGKAYKYFPLKATFLQAIFWFEVGSLICAVAKDSTTLIVGRAIAGAGGAGIAAGAYTIIAFSVSESKRPAFTGILGAVYAVAAVVGPLLGGVFTDHVSWRWCFYINLPIGGLSAAIIFFAFKAPAEARPVEAPLKEKILQMDPAGTFIFMGGIVCLLLALQWGGVSHAWNSSTIIGLLIGFGLIMILFVANEWYQQDRALLVPRILKQKTISLIFIYQFFNSAGFMLLLYFLPLYFQTVSGVSAADSGVRNLPFILGLSLMTIVSGIAITITGYYVPLLIVGSLIATVGNGLIYTLGVGSPSSEWIGYQALSGIGSGLSIQVPIIVAQALADPSDLSSNTAMAIFVQTLSAAVFIQLGQALFQNELINVLPHNVPDLNPLQVVATGATELREVFSADQLGGIVLSFLSGLQHAYILAIALAGVATLLGVLILVIDNRNLKGKAVGGGAA